MVDGSPSNETGERLPDGLMRYFESRAQQRQERFEQQWAALGNRERRLVREAAVMGFVRGHYFGGGRNEIPKDSAIVFDVLTAADHLSDLYPTLHRSGRYPQKANPTLIPESSDV